MSTATKKEEKKFNTTLAPLWMTKSGNYFSIELGPEHFDALQTVQVGGKLFIKFIGEDKRKSEKSPHAYLEYVTPGDVAKFRAENENKNNMRVVGAEDSI